MANTPFTILTSKNVPVDLSSKDFLKFTAGIKINAEILVDANGNIPYGRISGSEGFQAVLTRIGDIEETIGDEETNGTILKRIKILEDTDASTASTLTSLDTRITTNAGSITTINGTLTSYGTRITAVETAIGDSETAGSIIKRLDDIEESIGAGGDIADRLSTVEGKASANETAIGTINTTIGADDTTGLRKRIADLETKDVAHEGRLDAVEGKASANETAISGINTAIGTDDTVGTVKGRIKAVEDVVPTAASSSNQLADKSFVNSSIQTATAYFDGNWATLAAVPETEAGYTEAGLPVPGPNNYLVVLADETHSNQTWRYKYTGAAGVAYSKSLWIAEYKVNDTALTQAQVDALNSGITSALVAKISANETAISAINTTIGADDTTGLRKRIADLESDLNTANTGVKARLTAVEGKASTNESNISAINTTIGADDSTGLRKRIKDVEDAIGTDATAGSVKGRIKAIEDVVPYAASAQNELADKKYVDDADTALQNSINAINFLNLPATLKIGAKQYQLTIDSDDNLVMTKLDDAQVA